MDRLVENLFSCVVGGHVVYVCRSKVNGMYGGFTVGHPWVCKIGIKIEQVRDQIKKALEPVT